MGTNVISMIIQDFFRGKGSVDALTTYKKLEKQLDMTQETMDRLSRAGLKMVDTGKSGSRFYDTLNKNFISNEKAMMRMEKTTRKLRQTFSMEFLGVMFLGMQLQRTFTNLAKTTFSTFMKITEGMHPAAQASNALAATWTMLKFSIGEALATVLQQLLPVLIPIITKIADWVQQNQKLTAWLILGGIALGAFLFFVGQMYIGIEALINAIFNITSAVKAWSAASALAGAGLTTILLWVGLIIAILAVLYAAWTTNFAGIRDFTTGTLGIIFAVLKTVFKGIIELVMILFKIIVAIFEGDWTKVWNLTKLFGVKLLGTVSKLGAGLVLIFMNALLLIYNIIKDYFFGFWKIMLRIGGKILDFMGNLGAELAKSISKPLTDAVRSLGSFIRNIGNAISKIPGFGSIGRGIANFGKSLEKSDIGQKITEWQDAQRKLNSDNIEKALKNVEDLDKKFTTGYFGLDHFTSQVNEIDKDMGKLLTNNPEANLGFSVDGNNEQLGILDRIGISLDNIQDKTSSVNNASQSIIETKAAETDAWRMNNEEIERYINNQDQLISLSQRLSDGGGFSDLDRFSPNFVGQVNR